MADIIIHNQTMPKCCGSCYFNYDMDSCMCEAGPKDFDPWLPGYWKSRHPECPLATLPDRHGRLGDLDSILKEKYIIKPGDLLAEVTVVDACYISNAPTIIEAEGGTGDGT